MPRSRDAVHGLSHCVVSELQGDGPVKPTRRAFLKVSCAAAAGSLAHVVLGEKQDPNPPATRRLDESGDEASLLAAPEALFRPTATGCTVHWIPNGAVEARLLAGSDPQQLSAVYHAASAEPTEVVVNQFEAGTAGYLQCQFRRPNSSEWITRPLRRVQTARKAGAAFRVAFLADSHLYDHARRPRLLPNLALALGRVAADTPDFVVFLGDEASVYFRGDPPGYMNQERAHERWRWWRLQCAELLAAVPSFLALGNHEGEAGFHRALRRGDNPEYLQRWGTIARKKYLLNPLPTTYPEGGEDEGWLGDRRSPATRGAAAGNGSPLQNYFAWTWGNALFVVLDVHRYTNPGGPTPTRVADWTLGRAQLRWVERVLAESNAKWKFVIAHHLVGGSQWNLKGTARRTAYKYGRGGGRYARVAEQARITDLMKRHAAQCFFYGHDHVFAHQVAENIHFVCCGRPTYLSSAWWPNPGWKEAYGSWEGRDPHDFYAALGYVRLAISPEATTVQYVRTGVDPEGKENVETPLGEVVHGFTIRA